MAKRQRGNVKRRPRAPGRGSSAPSRRHAVAPSLSRYDLYELCVQSPERMVPFLRAVHGGEPRVMREDFCGSGGVCREWVRQGPWRGRGAYRAIGVDLDPEPLKRLCRVKNVEAVCADVMVCDAAADLISATNFPVGYWHTRKNLLRYLKATRRRLNAGGVFVCDAYGGSHAFTTGSTVRDFWIDGGVRIRYTWEQREADPLTGMVTDVVHFRGFKDRDVVLDLPDAFVYRWRLWSIQELRDAMEEAGFRATEVYTELADAKDSQGRVYVRPVSGGEELGENWVVCVVGRT